MKILSLFDGISCGRVALERAGIPVEAYHAYEIHPPAILISKKNWPSIVHKGDVITADFKQYQGFDILMGGSPCQSLSIVQSKTRQHLDGDKVHPTQKPLELITKMIEDSTEPGGVVLDTFCGSGTTAVACIKTGRNYIGFELDERYHAIAQQRIAAAVDEVLNE